MRCHCFIIPKSVLERFSNDESLSVSERKAFSDAADFETRWRAERVAQSRFSMAARTMLPQNAHGSASTTEIFSCNHSTALPGVVVSNPSQSEDATARRAFDETQSVLEFYREVFGRSSIDSAGNSFASSIHYSISYNNAFWNGSQMVYGDGDGNIFLDFTQSNDVIAHEITHGVTQFAARLEYVNQAGGLNESMSDVFGSMFRQWRGNQTVIAADWLIGKEIMGPGAIAKGFTCLRDLANPSHAHCLAPQPSHFSDYQDGMDPHASSGIANLAFYKAAMGIGGRSWERTGKIWYAALVRQPVQPSMTMSTFATRTRKVAQELYPEQPAIFSAVDQAWIEVGL